MTEKEFMRQVWRPLDTVFNCFDWVRDNQTPKVHPTQKPVHLLERLIEIFTDKGDVIIDPCAGSGSTLLAALNTRRRAYGFEIKKTFIKLLPKRCSNHMSQDYFDKMRQNSTKASR